MTPNPISTINSKANTEITDAMIITAVSESSEDAACDEEREKRDFYIIMSIHCIREHWL